MSDQLQDLLGRWTLDELDLDKPLPQLPTFIEDRDALVKQLFKIVNRGHGLESLLPSSRLKNIKEMDLETACKQQIQMLTKEKIKQLLSLQLNGSEIPCDDLPEALEKELEEERQNEKIIERGKENKKEQMKILETNFTDSPHSTASTSDDIRNVSTKEQKKSPLTDDLQMIVDEDEYEEFFNNEQDFKQTFKPSQKMERCKNNSGNKNSKLNHHNDRSSQHAEKQIPNKIFHETESASESSSPIAVCKKDQEKGKKRFGSLKVSPDVSNESTFKPAVSEVASVSKPIKNWRKPDLTSDDESSNADIVVSSQQDAMDNFQVSNERNQEDEKSSVESGEITSESEDEIPKVDLTSSKLMRLSSPVSSSSSSLSFTSSLDSFGRQKRKRKLRKHSSKPSVPDQKLENSSRLSPKRKIDKKPKREDDSDSSSLNAILNESPSTDEEVKTKRSQEMRCRQEILSQSEKYERHYYQNYRQGRSSNERMYQNPRQSNSEYDFRQLHHHRYSQKYQRYQQQQYDNDLQVSQEPEGEYERELRRYRDKLREAKREYLALCKKEQESGEHRRKISGNRTEHVETSKDAKSDDTDSIQLSDDDLLELSSLGSSSDEDPSTEEQKRLERLRRWRSKAEQTTKDK